MKKNIFQTELLSRHYTLTNLKSNNLTKAQFGWREKKGGGGEKEPNKLFLMG